MRERWPRASRGDNGKSAEGYGLPGPTGFRTAELAALEGLVVSGHQNSTSPDVQPSGQESAHLPGLLLGTGCWTLEGDALVRGKGSGGTADSFERWGHLVTHEQGRSNGTKVNGRNYRKRVTRERTRWVMCWDRVRA